MAHVLSHLQFRPSGMDFGHSKLEHRVSSTPPSWGRRRPGLAAVESFGSKRADALGRSTGETRTGTDEWGEWGFRRAESRPRELTG